MKAIHNLLDLQNGIDFVGNYKLKYNFESNSQQKVRNEEKEKVGNYKLKYNFESNSQQKACELVYGVGWEL